MKINHVVFPVLFAGLLLSLLFCCKKEAPKTVPTATISAVTNITATSASSVGEITSDGGAPIMERGVCYSTNQNPTTSDSKTTNGTGIGSFTVSLTGLTSGATYYLKTYATNSVGTGYSSQSTFKTLALASLLTTVQPSNVTKSSATSGGNITTDGGSPVIARGVCFNTSQNPTTTNAKTTDGTGVGSYSSSITGLIPNTTYYVRAYAINSVGIAYGSQINFTSSDYPNCGTVTDLDGNVYKTVTIGTQCWLRENLKTTKYRNGDPIPNVTSDATWAALATGAQCVYNNDANNLTVYGRLYNWYAVNDSRNIAPTGWHVASDAEWTTLTTYLGGITVAGEKLKENAIFPATSHWFNGGAGAVAATNETGFTAVGGGYRFVNGRFGDMFYVGYWMTSTGQARFMDYNSSNVGWSSGGGLSIRCVKD